MKKTYVIIGALFIAFIGSSYLSSEEFRNFFAPPPSGSGVVDLNNLQAYTSLTHPNYINRDNQPPPNVISNAGATLGRVLFYDKAMSVDNSISCASCHQQEFAFSDTALVSVGVAGNTARHSMRLVNARFGNEVRFFWDERATNLENQTTQPIQDHVEMGFSGTLGDPNLDSLITRLSNMNRYKELFTVAYGDTVITEMRMQQAMAQFIRSIQSFDSKYDVGRAMVGNGNAPFPNFTADENTGKQLFQGNPQFNNQGQRIGGGLGCQRCHQAPEFSITPNSQNNGVIAEVNGGNNLNIDRSPSLRDLFRSNGQQNGPFMHNGSLATFDAVLSHYNVIPNVPGLDNRLRPGGNPQRLNLTTTERNQVTAFINTLSGTNVYTDTMWSDPFNASGNLTVLGIDNDNDGYSVIAGDCDDNDATRNPGMVEICEDGIDNNCNGLIDENCCPDVTGLDAYVNASNQVHIGWDRIDTDYGQQIQYRVVGSSTWINSNLGRTATNAKLLKNLIPNTQYQYRMRVKCTGGNGNWSPIKTFTTYTSDPCSTPEGCHVMYSQYWDYSRVRLITNWEPNAQNGGKIQVQYKPLSANSWTRSTVVSRSWLNVLNLSSSTDYEMRWRAQCNGVWTSWGVRDTFSTLKNIAPIIPNSVSQREDLNLEEMDIQEGKIQIFPNPVQDYLSIQNPTASKIELRVYNLQGQLMSNVTTEKSQYQMDMQDIPKGIYFIRIEKDKELILTQKIIKL